MIETARIYLITPPVTDADATLQLLEQACASGEVSAVLVPLALPDERAQVNALKVLAPVVQRSGAALLATGQVQAGAVQVAVRGGADGLHLSLLDTPPEAAAETVDDAAASLKPERIVGVACALTRHDAMTAGEMDIDYLMFGEPAADGSLPDPDLVVEMTGWWAEIFAVPCVGYAQSMDMVRDLAATGAEFVAVGPLVWEHPAGPAAAIEAIRKTIDTAGTSEQ